MARQWLARASATLVSGIVLLTGAPMLVSAAEAATPSGTVNLGTFAITRAGGAAITMSVTVKCSAMASPPGPIPIVASERSVSVQVIQAQGTSTTSGWGNASVTCDNVPHTVRVDVLVSAPGAPFRAGIAFAKADLYECGPSFCGSITDADEIRIR
jgi:hypothetical protein